MRSLNIQTAKRVGILVVITLAILAVYNIAAQQKAIARQNAELKNTNTKLEQLETNYKKTNSELDKAKSDNNSSQQQVQQLQQQNTDLEKNKTDLEAQLQAKKVSQATKIVLATAKVTTVSTDTSGNGYTYGYCTWYVKTRRPDIGSFWGNASSWLYSAQAAGYSTGSTPQVGAIGVEGNHVVYVESVSGDTVTISEMNYEGWNVKSYRTTSASEFTYIY